MGTTIVKYQTCLAQWLNIIDLTTTLSKSSKNCGPEVRDMPYKPYFNSLVEEYYDDSFTGDWDVICDLHSEYVYNTILYESLLTIPDLKPYTNHFLATCRTFSIAAAF